MKFSFIQKPHQTFGNREVKKVPDSQGKFGYFITKKEKWDRFNQREP